MKNKKRLIAALLGIFLLSGCTAAPAEPSPSPAAEESPAPEAVEEKLAPEEAYMQALLAYAAKDFD